MEFKFLTLGVAMNLKVMNQENTQASPSQSFHKKLRLLCKPSSLFKGHLIVDAKTGDLESTHLIKMLFEKMKGKLRFGDLCNSKLIQVKVLNFLENGNHLLHSDEDHKCARDLARRAGKEASNYFKSSSFHQNNSSKEFFKLHQYELQPYYHLISFSAETPSSLSIVSQIEIKSQNAENTPTENGPTPTKKNRTTQVFLISAAGIGILIALGVIFALKRTADKTNINTNPSSPLASNLPNSDPISPSSAQAKMGETNSGIELEKGSETPKSLSPKSLDAPKKEEIFWNKASNYTIPALTVITTLGSVLAISGCLLGNKKTNFDSHSNEMSLSEKMKEIKEKNIQKKKI